MGRLQSVRAPASITGALAACMALLLASGSARAGQFQVGLGGDGLRVGASPLQLNTANAAAEAVDASYVRFFVNWASVAPNTTSRPAGFDASDPSDPHYNWSQVDASIRMASERHLQVILTFDAAPPWAEGPGPVKPFVAPGAWDPNPSAFAAFLHAAATRYSGSFRDPASPGSNLPRVKYWEPWNEPNIPGYFSAPNSISAYRTLLNDSYDALKGVQRDNVVIFGGLAPVSPVLGEIAPLNFASKLLCLHRVGSSFAPDRHCPQRAKFDIFGMHPYSWAATPTKHAYKPGDVLVGDIGELSALVSATNRFHTAIPGSGHVIWVTEFSWFTNPPNPVLGDRPQTAARYVAYSMYEMWKAGVRLVVWWDLLDGPGKDPGNGAGLYSASGQPKPTLQAVAFPVVAGLTHGRGFVWGRAPVSHSVRVVVERAVGRRWRTLTTVRTGRAGVFVAYFAARRNGVYRAQVVGGPTSLPYNSTPIPPRRTHLVNLF